MHPVRQMNRRSIVFAISGCLLLCLAFGGGYFLGQRTPLSSRDSEAELQERQPSSNEVARREQQTEKERFLSLSLAFVLSNAANASGLPAVTDSAAEDLIGCINELSERGILTVREHGGRPYSWTDKSIEGVESLRTATLPSVRFEDGQVWEIPSGLGRVWEGKIEPFVGY